MVWWHPLLNGHEFEQALGAGEEQGSLVCCSPWGRKGSDVTERLNNKAPLIPKESFGIKKWCPNSKLDTPSSSLLLSGQCLRISGFHVFLHICQPFHVCLPGTPCFFLPRGEGALYTMDFTTPTTLYQITNLSGTSLVLFFFPCSSLQLIITIIGRSWDKFKKRWD